MTPSCSPSAIVIERGTLTDGGDDTAWWAMLYDMKHEEDESGQPTDNPLHRMRFFYPPTGTSNKALACGDCEKGYIGAPEYEIAAVDKTYNHASNYKGKTHRKKHGSYLNVNKNGIKMFKIVTAEETTRADPTSEGVVAPIMGAAESRAVAARRKRRKLNDDPNSADDESGEEEEEEEEEGMGGEHPDGEGDEASSAA